MYNVTTGLKLFHVTITLLYILLSSQWKVIIKQLYNYYGKYLKHSIMTKSSQGQIKFQNQQTQKPMILKMGGFHPLICFLNFQVLWM